MAQNKSTKHALIDRNNSKALAMIAIASAIVTFSLVATRSLIEVSAHRSSVISEKQKASNQLKANDSEIGKLIDSFKIFENLPESVIGTSEKNSKIVLDALPPKYDFPALATSLEKIAQDGGYTITSIAGTDNELAETDDTVSNPQPVEMPFSLTVTGPYEKIKNLPVDLERSIRPIYILSMEISGSASNATMQLTAKTYYQAGKNLEVRFKEVR